MDVVGMDIYEPGIAEGKSPKKVVSLLRTISRFVNKHGKVAAFTETGLRKDEEGFRYPEKYPRFWTRNILELIKNDEETRSIAYVMSWYSADWQGDGTGQFYIPYPGIAEDHTKGRQAIDDFLDFYNDPFTFFEDNLPDLYGTPVE